MDLFFTLRQRIVQLSNVRYSRKDGRMRDAYCISLGDAKTLEKLHVFPGGQKSAKEFEGHTDHVFALAISSNGEYLASGGRDKKINIWSVKDNKHLAVFPHHKDAISVSIG